MNGNFLQRGELWVLGQSVLLCAVIAGVLLGRNQWQSLALTLRGAFLLLIAADGIQVRLEGLWIG